MASLRISKNLRPYERGKPLDMNLRHLIVTDLLEGQSVSDIAKKYRVDQSVVHKLAKKVIQTGSIQPMPGNSGRPSQLSPNDVIFIDHLIKWKPSTTYKEIHRELIAHSNLPNGTSTSAIGRVVRGELGMSFKKLTKCHPEKFTPANINYCRAFLNYMSTVPIGNLKFYDEAGINVAMTNPVYGHAKREERAVEIVKGRKGANWTLMLLCSQDGIDYAKLIEGACETFEYLRFLGEAGNYQKALGRNMFD